MNMADTLSLVPLSLSWHLESAEHGVDDDAHRDEEQRCLGGHRGGLVDDGRAA